MAQAGSPPLGTSPATVGVPSSPAAFHHGDLRLPRRPDSPALALRPPSTAQPPPSSSGGAGGRLATLRTWFALRRLRKGSGNRAKAAGPPTAPSSLDPLRLAGVASASPASSSASSTPSSASPECPLCLCEMDDAGSDAVRPPDLLTPCRHIVCLSCWQGYLRVQINESQVPIACPACPSQLHPDDVGRLLASMPDPEEGASLLAKFELYMVRRVLATVPEARWCPAPDCNFAIIAERCERCPRLKCLRPGCGTNFCYRCKQAWHPGKTCKTARAARIAEVLSAIDPIEGEVKKCPECGMYVLKMNDGTCNHMVCNICGCEFCWLCMSKVGDMHFLSPSGCTFWGRKPWSRRKRLFLQIATLVGAPVGIAILAGLAVPTLTFGIPVWAWRRAVRNLEEPDIHKLRLNAALAVFFSFMLSPFIAAVVVGVGVPVLFAYVYTVVPVALCRSLESACKCADIRERLLDCLQGSLEDVRRRSSLHDEALEGRRDSQETATGLWSRLRRWMGRVRDEQRGSSVSGGASGRRRRRRSSDRKRRKRRGEEEVPAGGEKKSSEDSKPSSGGASPPDMLRLENLLLGARSNEARQSVGPQGDSPVGSQRLQVLVHAEIPSQRLQSDSPDEPEGAACRSSLEQPVASSCPSRCTTPMTAVEIDTPVCPNDSPPASPASRHSPGQRCSLDGPRRDAELASGHCGRNMQRSQSLEMDSELVMLRRLLWQRAGKRRSGGDGGTESHA